MIKFPEGFLRRMQVGVRRYTPKVRGVPFSIAIQENLMSSEHHVDVNPELTKKFRATMLKTIEEIKEAVTNLDLSKENSAEHVSDLVETLQENADQRLGYLSRIRLEHERLAKLEQVQKGRAVQRDTTSLRDAAAVKPHSPDQEQQEK